MNTNTTEHAKAVSSTDLLGLPELLGNMDEWTEHFRHNQHGATLTMLRAKQTIRGLANRAKWLETQWEETKELLHAVGSGKADSVIRRAVEGALLTLETNYDIDGNSMGESDAANTLRSVLPNAEATGPQKSKP